MKRSIDKLIAPVYYEPWNDAVSGKATELWLPGGRYSAKSSFASVLIAAMMNSQGNEDTHATILRKHHVDLLDSVVNEMKTALGEDRLDLMRLYDFYKNPLRFINKRTGQTITFLGLDDPRKHKSKKPPFGYNRFLWFEETDEFTSWEEVEQVMISYQRTGFDFTTLFTFNPPRSSANWANAQAKMRAPGRAVYHTDYRDIAEVGWVPKSILERIEHMRRTNFEIYRHIYLGEEIGTGGEIFTNVKDCSITDEQIKAFANKSWGMDFGIVNDPTVLVGSHYDHDTDTIYIFDEAVLKHPYYTQIHEMLKKKGLEKEAIIADTAPAGWIQNINRLGANLKGCYKADDWVETGVSWLRSRSRILCDSARCPFTFNELVHYEYDTYKDGTPKERLPDRDNHSIDALRYGREFDIKASAAKKFIGKPVGINRRY